MDFGPALFERRTGFGPEVTRGTFSSAQSAISLLVWGECSPKSPTSVTNFRYRIDARDHQVVFKFVRHPCGAFPVGGTGSNGRHQGGPSGRYSNASGATATFAPSDAFDFHFVGTLSEGSKVTDI